MVADLPTIAVSELGGDTAVDLLNTVDWRLDPDRRSERLTSFAHVLAWMHRIGWLDEGAAVRLQALGDADPQGAAREHGAALQLRDQVYTALCEGGSTRVLTERLTQALPRLDLVHGETGRWRWQSAPAATLHAPVDRMALELARLLTSPDVVRFGRCDDDACGWVFLDTSRQHNRRWCSATDCGNRNRVRAHYRRSRTAARASHSRSGSGGHASEAGGRGSGDRDG